MDGTLDTRNRNFGWINWLESPVHALPLDIWRIVTASVCSSYFLRTLFEVKDYTGVHGLIDHELSARLFPFTRLTLFNASMPDLFSIAVFLLAAISSFALMLGYRSKTSALILYVIAVSTYRRNFLVMYVEDAIVHLMLFWTLLLPIGRTLTIKDFVADRSGAWEKWKRELVSGAATRCFMMNLALIYLVAGLWKWTSPMWRTGTAVSVIMQLPISYAYQAWNPQYVSFLVPLNYLALVFEPLFGLLCLLRPGRVKYCLGIALAAFHVFIIVTMKLPFANLLCLGALSIIFGDELMQYVLKVRNAGLPPAARKYRMAAPSIVGLSVVVLLALAMLSSVNLADWRRPIGTAADPVQLDAPNKGPNASQADGVEGLGRVQRPFFAALWAVGLAQQYQLLNWIDDRNYLYTYSIVERGSNGNEVSVDANRLFPMSPRSVILQSYMHGIVWDELPTDMQRPLRDGLKSRYAARYCRSFDPSSPWQKS